MKSFWEASWKAHKHLVAGNFYGLVRCEPAWCWNTSGFKDFDLWICLDGSGEISIDGTTYAVTRGFSVCFPPGHCDVEAVHDPSNPLQVFFMHFKLEGGAVAQATDYPRPLPKPLIVDPFLWSTIDELISNLEYLRNPVLEEALLWQLLLRREIRDVPPSVLPEERLRLLVRQIREAPAKFHKVEEMARASGLSAGHFRRIFKRLTGTAPLQFVLNCRIDRACYFLTQTKLPVASIAETVGYADVYFFSRQFKERTGMSPSHFRRIN